MSFGLSPARGSCLTGDDEAPLGSWGDLPWVVVPPKLLSLTEDEEDGDTYDDEFEAPICILGF